MIETIRPASAPDAKIALFDFDGSLSLIRTGWMEVMIPMMIEILSELQTGETGEQLRAVIEDFVWRLTGQETVYQMMELARQVTLRGGAPLDPLVYKHRYLDRLSHVIGDRLEGLRRGQVSPERYLVPGSRAILEALRARGLRLYLASGTDEIFMKEEADLLDVSRYFDGGVYGALDDFAKFSKRILIHRILQIPGIEGAQIIGFGDGYVEIEEVKQVGGVGIGLATDEPECRVPDPWKRQRLIGVGADYIIPNYLDYDDLLTKLAIPPGESTLR
jgi:phosphoglycolate phosphatase-like HAD superfamily hydrolase